MAQFVFKVNGVDYSDCVLAMSGFEWEKDDIEHDSAGRSKVTATMRRRILARKRKGTVTCRLLRHERISQLANALNVESVNITILDLIAGQSTYLMYCTRISAGAYGNINGVAYWDKCKFELTEV